MGDHDRGDRFGATVGVLRHRDFRRFWIVSLASNSGTWLHIVLSTILVFEYTQSAGALGLFGFIAYLPLLLFTLPAGVMSDRWDRRKIVVITHVAAALAVAALAIAVPAGLRSVEAIAITAFIVYTTYAIAKPALSSIFPTLVTRAEIPQATAVNSLSFVLGQLIGPLIVALLVAIGLPALGFALNAASYLGVAFVVARLPSHQVHAAQPASRLGLTELLDAFRYVITQRHIRAMLIAVLVGSPMPEVVRLLAPAAVARVGAEPSMAGVLAATVGFGGAAGLIVVARLYGTLGYRRAIVGALLILGAGALVIAWSPSVTALLAGAMALGIGYGVTFATATGSIQTAVPDMLRGRVMAIHTLVHLGMRPLFTPVAGWLGGLAGVAAALAGFVLLIPVALTAVLRDAPESSDPAADPEATSADA